MKIYANELKNYIGKKIEFQGFVDNVRDLQYVQFLILRDGTGKVQVTIEKEDSNKELNEIVSSLTLESTLIVKGTLNSNEKVKLNNIEIIPTDIEITSLSLTDYPIDIKDIDLSDRETRLDNRFLDLRKEKNRLIFEVQTTMIHAMREFWIKNNYIEMFSPKISGASAESGAEVFKLNYFETEACLSQSPQFYKQMAMAAGFDKVFEIGPAFRAENSHTSYHATEISMIDMEISWIKDEFEVMLEQEKWIKFFMSEVKSKHGSKIKELFNVSIDDLNMDFPRIEFDIVKEIIKSKYNYESFKKYDLDKKDEEFICKYVKETYNCDFVFITKFPFEGRPFYHMLDENKLTRSFDLLYKGIEITTGAQREHRYDILKQQTIEKGIDVKSLEFYLDFFKYGCPPHGGLGVGIGRILMSLFEIDNIREVTYVYRGPNRLKP